MSIVGSSTDTVASNEVHTALAHADVADLTDIAATSEQGFHNVEVAGAGRLDDVGRLLVLLVNVRELMQRLHLLGRCCEIAIFLDQVLDHFGLLSKNSGLEHRKANE